ncbi:hypothetical protein [Mycobacterium sp.]|uniref:hypothetical protein n=1 Tax=Mycobacterium sp. TaxID=1785 RepID=UPI0025DE91F1|nr:hypothetical protein [Mycobacterium sp.]MBW0013622.1 hypothetical protein [Mycobacterium sp.]
MALVVAACSPALVVALHGHAGSAAQQRVDDVGFINAVVDDIFKNAGVSPTTLGNGPLHLLCNCSKTVT